MLAILFASILLLASAGHIYPQDVLISPNNRDTLSNITLVFTPETSLLPSDFLRMTFPFHIKSIQSAYWDTYVNCSTSQPTKSATVTESTLPNDVDTYFVQLYTDLEQTNLSNITGNVTYYLIITGIPEASSQSDMSLPVQMYTISNNFGNWIVYDSNPVFGLVSLASPYPTTMIVALTVPPTQTNSKVLNSTYTAYIDITPTVTITGEARVDIELTNPSFSIVSCSSVGSTADSVTSVSAVFTPLAPNIMRGIILETLVGNRAVKYRFACVVQNPTSPGLSGITVRNSLGYADTITESGDGALSLEAALTVNSGSTAKWDELSHKVELGWGLEGSASSALPVFSLYRDASPTESWYQSVKTTFKPKTDLNMTDKVQVVVSTIDDSGFKILAATIYHNLPNFSDNETVSCSVITQGFLTCINVGVLEAKEYFVSFRFAVTSTTATTTVIDFGKVKVQTQVDSPVNLISLSQTTLRSTDIATNPPLFTDQGKQGIIAYATTSDGQTRDYVTAGEDITLNFRFNYFSNSTIPVTLDEIDMGIEFYTSYKLSSTSAHTCGIMNLVEGQDIQTSNCAVQTSPSEYSKLSFRIGKLLKNDTTSPPGIQFQPNPQKGTVYFTNVRFDAQDTSSLTYVNEYIYDYYGRWVQGFDATNPTIVIADGSAPFFFNSLVYTAGALSTLNVGTTFFVTGQSTGGIGNDGTDFPTFIRITGSERTSATRLILFFNDLEPLNPDTPCFGPAGIECKYTNNGLDTTQTDSLTDYSGSRRMEINTDLTTEINIYIPVKTFASKNIMGFFVVTASQFDESATTQGIFKTEAVKRVATATYTNTVTGTALPIDPSSTTTPRFNVPSNSNASAVVSSNLANIQTAYRVATPNTASNIGAAYGYCGNYDFTVQEGFSFTPFYTSTETPSQLCVKVNYSPSENNEVTCEVCPVHSAMTAASLRFNQFTLPSMSGVDYYDLVYVTGTNDGALAKAAKDNQKGAMNAFTLSDHNITFAPENLVKQGQNVLTMLSFTTVSALPQSIRVILRPNGASQSLSMTPVSQYGCQVVGVSTTSCSIIGNDTQITIDIVASDQTWPATNYVVQFMVDSMAEDITADLTVNYRTTIMVNGVDQSLEALHHTSTTQTYSVTNADSEPISLTNVTYLFGTQGARSMIFVNFQIPNTTRMYAGQDLIFDLGAIADNNIGETPQCVIRDTATGNISNAFGSCDVYDLHQLTINCKDSVYGTFALELGFLQIPTASKPGVSARLVSVDGTTNITTMAPVDLPTTVTAGTIPTANIAIKRLYSSPGDVADLSITVTPSVHSLSVSSQVYVYFPDYYSEKLGYKNIWCTANDLPLTCSIIRPRLMMFTSFTPEIDIATPVTIRIYGILTPIVPVPPGTIFVAIDQDNNMTALSEFVEVNDQASVAFTSDPLAISSFSVSTNRIRQVADYTFSFTTNSDGIRANQVITIDFPDRYGAGLQGQEGPWVLISKTGDSVTNNVQTITFGSRFKVILPLDLDPLTSYTFVIKAIDNPDYETCKMDRPTVTIANRDETIEYLRTVPTMWDGPLIDYVADPNQKSLNWEDSNGQPLTSLTITLGTYSQEIRIAPPENEYFNSDISFSTSQSDITLSPPILTALQGSPYVSLRVGAPNTAIPRTALVKFNKEESWITDVYSELPKLQIILTTEPKTIPTPALRIMRGGTSLPYQWQFDQLDMMPHTGIEINAQINDAGTSSLSFVGSDSVDITPDTPVGGFTFRLSENAQSAPSFNLSIGGHDASSYKLASEQVEVVVLDPINEAPVVNNLTLPTEFAPTRQQVIVNVSQMSSVYWYVAKKDKLSTNDCEAIKQTYQQGFVYDPSSDNQDQYGVFYIYTENEDTISEIDNLSANQEYSYVMCFVNQLNYTDSRTGEFKTQDNGAALYLVTLTFDGAINRNQLASVVCVFNRALQLPNLNVVAMDGTTCSMASPFTSFPFDYTTITLYIYGDKYSDVQSTTNSSLDSYISSITTQTPSSFLNEFNDALAGVGILQLFNAISKSDGSTYSAPALGSVPTATASSTTIMLSGLSLSSGRGIFYAIADPESIDVPTRTQVRSMVNSEDIGVQGGGAIYLGTPSDVVISGLDSNTEYTVYYYGTSEDRTQYAAGTNLLSMQVRTLVSDIAMAGSRLEGGVTMVLVIIGALLALVM